MATLDLRLEVDTASVKTLMEELLSPLLSAKATQDRVERLLAGGDCIEQLLRVDADSRSAPGTDHVLCRFSGTEFHGRVVAAARAAERDFLALEQLLAHPPAPTEDETSDGESFAAATSSEIAA